MVGGYNNNQKQDNQAGPAFSPVPVARTPGAKRAAHNPTPCSQYVPPFYLLLEVFFVALSPLMPKLNRYAVVSCFNLLITTTNKAAENVDVKNIKIRGINQRRIGMTVFCTWLAVCFYLPVLNFKYQQYPRFNLF